MSQRIFHYGSPAAVSQEDHPVEYLCIHIPFFYHSDIRLHSHLEISDSNSLLLKPVHLRQQKDLVFFAFLRFSLPEFHVIPCLS